MNRLRAYRYLENLNQEELAALLGVSPQWVSAVEGGRRAFTGDLSALGYSNDRINLPEMSEPLHRQRASTKVSARNKAHEQLRLAGEVFAELAARTPKSPAISLERFDQVTDVNELEELAVEVRCMLNHSDSGPIRNLTLAVERAGVCLVPIVLPGIDGLSAWVNGIPVIGVSPSVPGDRFRHTLSHELAHLLIHRRKTGTVEQEANRFAGALLFPLAEFDAAMPPRPALRDFVNLKASWGVSVAALVYRAHELNYIDDQRYRSLQIQMSKWRRTEPSRFDPVHGQLVSKLIDVNKGVTSVAKNLGVNQRHLAELVNWSHLRVAS